MRDAKKFLAELKRREDDVEKTKEVLEDRLDDVGDRELATTKKEQELLSREQGIERQSKLTANRAAKLTQSISDFEVKKSKEEKDIDARKTAVFLRERSALAKEETQRRTEEALKKWEIQLIDGRETLGRAWAELEKKKQMPN